MTAAYLARFASALVAGLVSLAVSGCATGDLLSYRSEVAGVKYDAQECVEHALRNQPEEDTVREAAVAFAGACREGEAASCSALGVMYELGRGFPVSTPHALALYGAACEAHNLRACENRDSLLLRDPTATRDPARANQKLAQRGPGSGG
jgi:TPR repeat protein